MDVTTPLEMANSYANSEDALTALLVHVEGAEAAGLVEGDVEAAASDALASATEDTRELLRAWLRGDPHRALQRKRTAATAVGAAVGGDVHERLAALEREVTRLQTRLDDALTSPPAPSPPPPPSRASARAAAWVSAAIAQVARRSGRESAGRSEI